MATSDKRLHSKQRRWRALPRSKSTLQAPADRQCPQSSLHPMGQWFCHKRMPIHTLLPVPWKFQPKMFLSMEAARLLPLLANRRPSVIALLCPVQITTSGWNVCLCTISASSWISLPEWKDVYSINRFSFPLEKAINLLSQLPELRDQKPKLHWVSLQTGN